MAVQWTDSDHWKISYSQVTITNHKLGGGGYGTVHVGWFQEQKVAVKQLHTDIVSEHNLALIQREMDIMSKLRHPNLLLFIAAAFDHPSGAPLIVTELMDMPLRHAYEKKLLSSVGEKLVIMRDAAAGLNYLHCLPDPIIHRDVSSANVLLEAKGPGLWKTKISDFGSANVGTQAVTLAPGAIIYSAPEALQSISTIDAVQTVKMDVFSFGVLLCEVLNNQLPASNTLFKSMLYSIHTELHASLLCELIQDCTKEVPNKRPTMKSVIEKIKQYEELVPRGTYQIDELTAEVSLAQDGPLSLSKLKKQLDKERSKLNQMKLQQCKDTQQMEQDKSELVEMLAEARNESEMKSNQIKRYEQQLRQVIETNDRTISLLKLQHEQEQKRAELEKESFLQCLMESKEKELPLKDIIEKQASKEKEQVKINQLEHCNVGNEPREIHVLIIGKPGTGKSSLANVVLGYDQFADQITPCQREIWPSVRHYGKAIFHVYDTCGLFNGEEKEVLQKIQEATPGCEYDVVIVCMMLTDRLDHNNKNILKTVNALRPDIWSSVHIALTHTDQAVDIAKTKKQSPDHYAEGQTMYWKREINVYLPKELGVSADIVSHIHNTSYEKIKSKLKILNNWLPRLVLNVLCGPRVFTFSTALSMAVLHHTAGPAIRKAIAKPGWFGWHGEVTIDSWLATSTKGDAGCEEMCKLLKEC